MRLPWTTEYLAITLKGGDAYVGMVVEAFLRLSLTSVWWMISSQETSQEEEISP